MRSNGLLKRGLKNGSVRDGTAPKGAYSVEIWHSCVKGSKQFIKGWGGNQRGVYKKARTRIVEKLKELDSLAESGLMNEELWTYRYKLEAEMETLYAEEEEYWWQRAGEEWVIKGDSNNSFFSYGGKWEEEKENNCVFRSPRGGCHGPRRD